VRRIRCPKCESGMEEGFVADQRTQAAAMQQVWYAGEPTLWFWGALKLRGRDSRKVSTYRCRRCGFLESYAEEGG